MILLLLAIPGLIVMLALGIAFRGVALALLWAWFIAPLFGLPDLNIGQALGLSIFANMLIPQQQFDTETGKPYSIWVSLSGMLITVILAYFLHVTFGVGQ